MDPATIDTGLVTSLIGVAESCLGLFSKFPMNVFLIGSIIGLAFGIIKKAKKVAK